jgi:hypothetical protein
MPKRMMSISVHISQFPNVFGHRMIRTPIKMHISPVKKFERGNTFFYQPITLILPQKCGGTPVDT